ncbi:MAG: restriction endonuclease subunit S, partial [Candidatus Omnitrophica bacterium]|nr:restriction endonuclease subunit S [Candidatus Omnitrophota bacterium]
DSARSFSVDIKVIKKEKYKLSLDKYRSRGKNATNFVKLGQICNIIIGGTPSRKDMSLYGGKNLWVKIKDMNQMYISDTDEKITDKGVAGSSVKLLPKGTLLFSFKLTIGKVAIAKKKLYTNEAIAGIVPQKDIPNDRRVLSKYLYYLMPRLNYASYGQRAAKGKTLNKDILKTLEIPLPSLRSQERIVKELDKKEAEKERYLQAVARLTEGQNKKINKLI